MSEKNYLLATRGAGSAIAEAFLALGDIPYTKDEFDYDEPGPLRDKLFSLNPLGQVPTLVLPDGSVLTETLAIAQYVNAKAPQAGLVPKEKLESYWRWSLFIIAAIYPTFTYGDTPSKWVSDPKSAELLRQSTDRWREKLWLEVEKNVSAPYFLGKTFSSLDIYLAVMTYWRPRREWFQKSCPKIFAVSEQVKENPKLAQVWKENFKA